MKKSIPSAYALNPGELILCMDAPKNLAIEVELDIIHQNYKKSKPPTKREERCTPPSPDAADF